MVALFLESTVHFLVRTLRNPKLSSVATQSLEAICSTGREKISSYVNDFLDLCVNIDQYPVPNDAILGLLRGIMVKNLFDTKCHTVQASTWSVVQGRV